MDVRSGKRGLNRGYNAASKSSIIERDQNSQFCNRIGCSGRIKYIQNKRTENETTSRKPSSSSTSSVVPSSSKKPFINDDGKRKLPSQESCDTSESSLLSDSEAPEPVSTPSSSSSTSSSSGYQSESKKKSGKTIVTEAGSSRRSSNVNPRKVLDHKTTLHNRNASAPSSVVAKRTTLGPVSGSSGNNKYGLRSMKCNTMSDVVPQSCSSSDAKAAGKNVSRKRSQEGENGVSRRGERKTTPSLTSGISISNSVQRSSVSNEDRNRVGSTWTRRSVNVNSRAGFSYRQNGRNNVSVREAPVNDNVSTVSDNDISFRVGGRSLSRPFSSNSSSSSSRSHGLSRSNNDNPLAIMPYATTSEPGFTPSINRDSLRRYNMTDIAEVLFALEMIEQDEELTHEQVRVLETSLLLRGFNIYDQHRDMRLDIDNMSYEELLALEERMGTVSTALSEEEISKCLEKGIYKQTTSLQVVGPDKDVDDAKCSICQEEYEVGDEMGTLVLCKHGYHMACVTQWLRLKNWCPICKASASSRNS